ncbi:MAG: tyrosine-type recombinase/integrase [Patescibacteria group bacterium]
MTHKPLPSYLQNFLDWLDVEQGLSANTQKNYSNYLDRFFYWLRQNNLEGISPEELTEEHISQYRLFLSRGRSLKKTTQNRYLVALRSFLMYFMEHRIPSLSSERVKLAREKEDRKIHFLTLEQLRKLFDIPDILIFHGLRDRTILETFFSTGLRIAELVALNREQIVFPKDLSQGLEIAIIGKGGRVRTIYFSERALQWIKRYLEARDDMDEALFVSYRSERKKTGVSRTAIRTIQSMFERYAPRAGITIASIHSLRHSFATDMLGRGVDIRILQEFLGHKHIAATQIYAHVTSKRLKDIHKEFHGGKELGND